MFGIGMSQNSNSDGQKISQLASMLNALGTYSSQLEDFDMVKESDMVDELIKTLVDKMQDLVGKALSKGKHEKKDGGYED